jgi:cleavage and polyadenylation specificity factor subunit 1
VHPDPAASLALCYRRFHYCHGCGIATKRQQRLAAPCIFSKKINPTQQKYSTYDRELLAAYQAVKYFSYMLEARYFIIFTYHKPITYTYAEAYVETRQVLTTAVQQPGLPSTIHDR